MAPGSTRNRSWQIGLGVSEECDMAVCTAVHTGRGAGKPTSQVLNEVFCFFSNLITVESHSTRSMETQIKLLEKDAAFWSLIVGSA